MSEGRRILVIKLSALGDFVQAMGPFAAIRDHHAADHITLLTTKPFAELGKASPYFDDVWIDSRPRAWEVAALLRFRRRLRSAAFDMVYDLQTSDRSSSYFFMMGQPDWSGIAHGCSYPHANPDRDCMHTLDRQADQLRMAGIPITPPPDLSWIEADVARFALPARHALMVPGGSVHRPAKRWAPERFAEVAAHLAGRGICPVLLGGAADKGAIEAVAAAVPAALALTGRTSLSDIAVLARDAVGAIGNDTGPMHLIAAAGCPAVVLFSDNSDPALCAPRGRVAILRRPNLADLPVDEVIAALEAGEGAMRGEAGVRE